MISTIIYMNIDSKGKIDHHIADLENTKLEVTKKLERLYDYSYIQSNHGLYYWCKRHEWYHFAVSSNQIPDALRAFILLMGV